MKMKHYLPAAALALAFAACSDDYDDSALWDAVNGNTQRIEALEAWQAEVNNNIAALQQLLNTNDMITAVTPVTMGGETVGYTLSFLHSDPVTIYNGTQGEKGEEGDTPQIGLTQGEDGNWYWTLNGGLMSDAEGNPIRANGEDGEDGEDGTDGDEGPQGPAGADAPTPEIKLGNSLDSNATIETDNGNRIADGWYLSVDEGETWYRVSGEDGDPMFSDKPKVDEENGKVIFYLSGGAKIEVPLYQGITLTFTSSDNNPIDPNEPITVTGSTLDISYTVNGIEDAKLSAIPSAEGWSATVSDKAITVEVTTGAASECDLLVTATDNAGNSVSYTLSLQYDYLVDENTYIVASTAELKAVADIVNDGSRDINIILDKDIDLTNTTWTPIGIDDKHQYIGTFDGGNHTISGLTVTGSDQYAGLFGYIGDGGTVKNVKLENVRIASGYQNAYVGGVVGYSFFGNIENCSVSGSVSGNSNSNGTYNGVGGVVGYQWGGSITGCSSSATVQGTGGVGGVVGQTNFSAILTACYATKDVTVERTPTNNTYAGGVVGYNGASTLTACYATGSVTVTGDETGSIYVGGVTGNNVSGALTACYHAAGTVSGPDGATGGVAGQNFENDILGKCTLTACYWNGTVTGDNGIGNDMTNAGEATKVEGSTTWETAMSAMNTALSGTGWKYVSGSADGLPVLQKKP